jgi:succinate dehydrogenase / fumarate reductase flavoprotein subunit
LRENDLAEEAFERSLRLNPNDPDANHNFAWFLCENRREEESIRAGLDTIVQLKGRYADIGLTDRSQIFNTEVVQALELGNMLDVAEAVVLSAVNRRESRGAHTRTDFPTRNDGESGSTSLVKSAVDGPRLS